MVRIIENYTLYEPIGQGAYGKVYRAVNKLDNKQYAVKVIEVKKFLTNKKLEECTVHEINILTNIEKNNHIIAYYDMLKTQNNFYFVYEYCNGGTLEGMLRKENTLDEKGAMVIMRQLLEAFQVLNKYNIMHRDLKPDNIFFHNNILKVGDFGFCKSLQKAEMTKTMLGSPIYMAPEILNGQIYSNKADIWSIGVVLYEMLYGFCPFQSNSIPKLIEVLKQTELDFPNDIQISNETKKLLKKILTKDPQKRIQWMELFQLKISPEGILLEQSGGKLPFDDNKDIVRTAREIQSVSDETSNSSYRSGYQGQPGSTQNFQSPRNAALDGINRSVKNGEDKSKVPFLRKDKSAVEQVDASSSPVRKMKTMPDNNNIKDKVIKFHNDMVRGINIARSMGLNQQKNTPIFALFLLKGVSDQIKQFKEEELPTSSLNTSELKSYRQILDQESDELDFEIAMLRGKVEQFTDWKRAVKAKVLQFKNLRLCYELVMFLSGQLSNDNISHNQMSYVIRSKIA